jgi:shikimate kinase
VSDQPTERDQVHLDQHLVLIGMTGSGKSSVGQLCARRIGAEFVDADEFLERLTGTTVRSLFELEGEAGFRRREHEVLAELVQRDPPIVLASGGGVVLAEDNRALLRSGRCRVVWLRIEPDALEQRVRNREHRPLLDDDPVGALQAMWTERAPLYHEVADAIVSVENRTIAEVVEAVLR